MASDDVLDAYMVITGTLATGGTIHGETLDVNYGPDGGFQITDFSWSIDHSGGSLGGSDDLDGDGDGEDEEEAKTKKRRQASLLLGHTLPSRGKIDKGLKGSTVATQIQRKQKDDKNDEEKDSKEEKRKKKEKRKKSRAGNTMVTKADLRVNKVKISKLFDSASTSLFNAICEDTTAREGQLKGTIYFRKTGAKPGGPPYVYFQIELDQLMVISVEWDFDDEFPTEDVEFEFNKVRLTYIPQKADGTQDRAHIASWDRNTDVETNS